MEKLNMHTQDMAEANIEKIGQLFPNCLTERLNDKGEPEKAIDFDKLKHELSKEIVEGNQERYQFTWPGKREAIRIASTKTNTTLRPCRERSVNFNDTENLYIEGDNLEVLKLLRENYLGGIKVIYIDPPYNTGSDFVYGDDFSQDYTTFKDKSGIFDNEGNMILDRYDINTVANGRFHSDWLNMMYSRLKCAKDLLSPDGLIFVSIGDTELTNLKKILEEIFGAQNFIAQINVVTGANQAGEGVLIQKNVEYCVVFAKDINQTKVNRVDKTDETWRNLNDAPSPLSTRLDMGYSIYYNPSSKDMIPILDYDKDKVHTNDADQVYHDDTNLISKGYIPIRPGMRNGLLHRWRWGIDTFKERKDEIQMFKSGNSYIPKFQQSGFNPPKNIQNFSGGASDLKKLFGERAPFDYPKNVSYIMYLLSVGMNNGDTVLDFFSGSATTAHAIFELNKQDNGSRKFILVQLPELVEEKTEAYKQGFRTICDIGIERIKRSSIETEKCSEHNQLFSNDSSTTSLDTGFRVLKLDTSNMQDVYYTPETSSENTLFEDNVKPDRTPEDLLFQVMLECNIPLSAKIEAKKISGKDVFSVNDGYLIACFDEDINEAVITEVAKQKPYYFIMRDKSLSSDQVADNFEQIFNAYSKDTIRKII